MMTSRERVALFRDYWPAACRVNGWAPNDNARRHEVTLECMRLVRGPAVTTSSPAWGRDETTALFCYLDFLASPDSLDLSAAWDTCQADYRTFNRARQADWHQRALYGSGQNKLTRERFGGQQTAAGEVLDDLDPEAVRQRHMTLAKRHQVRDRNLRRAGQPVPAVEQQPFLDLDPVRSREPVGSAAPF